MSKALYRDWLRRNEVLVQCLEGLVEHASWLLPDRFSSLEGPVELFRSLSGALSVFNGYMLANPAGFQGHFWLSLLSQFEVLVEMAAQRLETSGQIRSKYNILLVLEAIKIVTKLKTLFAQRSSSMLHGSVSDTYEEATFQEQLSTALRAMHEAASALSASQHRREGGSLGHDQASVSAWWHSSPLLAYAPASSRYSSGYCSPLRGQPIAGGAPPTPMTPDDASTAGSRPLISPLGATCLRPDPQQNACTHTPPMLSPSGAQWGHPRHTSRSHHFQGRSAHPLHRDTSRLHERACRVLRMGEILAIVRPLLYVTLMRRFGPRSWLPWTLALACEAVALSLTTMAQRILSKVHAEDTVVHTCAYTGTSASALYTLLWRQPVSRADTELRRRRWQLALYILRDPFYRQLLWPQLQGACQRLSSVRVVGGLARRMFEILDGVQKYYVYTSGS